MLLRMEAHNNHNKERGQGTNIKTKNPGKNGGIRILH